MIAVGAAMVSSINVVEGVIEGKEMRRGEEHGYFEFGGSTIVLLFDAAKVEWDADLLQASQEGIEVIVKQGEQIGRYKSDNTTQTD